MNARRYAVVCAIFGVVLAGCASTKPSAPSAKPPEGSRNIGVRLLEYSVIPSPDTGRAGKVTFAVRNTGKDVHEFVVIKTDLSPFDLPTKKDGSVDEDKVDGVDELEDIAPGTSKTLKVDLRPGAYALICNRVEKDGDKVEVHYKLGMRSPFKVR